MSGANGNHQRVLVVDDAEDLRESMSAALETLGYDVLVAVDPDQALLLLRSTPVNVVITDIMMGGGPGGLDLITHIRSDFAPPVPPIIACSGFPDFDGEAIRRGAVSFLPKPFTFTDLQDAVTTALTNGTVVSNGTGIISDRARSYRNRAGQAAESVFRNLGSQRDMVRERARAGAKWLSAYLGAQHAVMVALDGGSVRVQASNDEALLPVGGAVDEWLPLCRDVVESRASLALPDIRAFPAIAAKAKDLPARSFAAVPVLADEGVAFGAVCVFDERPNLFEPEDLAILEEIGRRASALIRDPAGAVVTPFFADSDILAGDTFVEVLGLELRRIRRTGGFIEVAAIRPMTSAPDGVWLEAVERVARGYHRALSRTRYDSVRLFVSSKDEQQASHELAGAVSELRQLTGIRAAGIVALAGTNAPTLSEHEVLQIAEALSSYGSRGHIERTAIRSEPWPSFFDAAAQDAR